MGGVIDLQNRTAQPIRKLSLMRAANDRHRGVGGSGLKPPPTPPSQNVSLRLVKRVAAGRINRPWPFAGRLVPSDRLGQQPADCAVAVNDVKSADHVLPEVPNVRHPLEPSGGGQLPQVEAAGGTKHRAEFPLDRSAGMPQCLAKIVGGTEKNRRPVRFTQIAAKLSDRSGVTASQVIDHVGDASHGNNRGGGKRNFGQVEKTVRNHRRHRNLSSTTGLASIPLAARNATIVPLEAANAQFST